MSYREALPEGCPPAEAEEVVSLRNVFRLVRSNPATLDDFRSQRAERPNAVFTVSECLARGLSVYAVRQHCEKPRKLPRFRYTLICTVSLDTGAGRLQQTFQPSHHSWWPLAEFDILAHCRIESV